MVRSIRGLSSWICAALLIALATGGSAEGNDDTFLSDEYEQCMDASGGVTSSMRECSSAEYQRLDARMERAYSSLSVRLSPRDLRELKRSQRRWRREYRQRCDDEAAIETPGTLALVMYDGCVLAELSTRIQWLERQSPARQ